MFIRLLIVVSGSGGIPFFCPRRSKGCLGPGVLFGYGPRPCDCFSLLLEALRGLIIVQSFGIACGGFVYRSFMNS